MYVSCGIIESLLRCAICYIRECDVVGVCLACFSVEYVCPRQWYRKYPFKTKEYMNAILQLKWPGIWINLPIRENFVLYLHLRINLAFGEPEVTFSTPKNMTDFTCNSSKQFLLKCVWFHEMNERKIIPLVYMFTEFRCGNKFTLFIYENYRDGFRIASSANV